MGKMGRQIVSKATYVRRRKARWARAKQVILAAGYTAEQIAKLSPKKIEKICLVLREAGKLAV
jgi:L-2-hydroxyglutarate oxidase LhgO